MSQIRMQNHFGAVRAEERYYIDADLLREIKQVSVTGYNPGLLLELLHLSQTHAGWVCSVMFLPCLMKSCF